MEANIEVTIDVNQFLKHINRFFRWRAAADILSYPLKWSTKEISESVGALVNMKQMGLDFKDPTKTCYVVGDGVYPRTGVLLAHLTKWNIISIDPGLNKHVDLSEVKHFTAIKSRVEDKYWESDHAIICLVHSHATLPNCLKHITGRKSRCMISIPCCVPHDDFPTDEEYKDLGILSDKNIVKIWDAI